MCHRDHILICGNPCQTNYLLFSCAVARQHAGTYMCVYTRFAECFSYLLCIQDAVANCESVPPQGAPTSRVYWKATTVYKSHKESRVRDVFSLDRGTHVWTWNTVVECTCASVEKCAWFDGHGFPPFGKGPCPFMYQQQPACWMAKLDASNRSPMVCELMMI